MKKKQKIYFDIETFRPEDTTESMTAMFTRIVTKYERRRKIKEIFDDIKENI
jgi:hypothetical protein